MITWGHLVEIFERKQLELKLFQSQKMGVNAILCHTAFLPTIPCVHPFKAGQNGSGKEGWREKEGPLCHQEAVLHIGNLHVCYDIKKKKTIDIVKESQPAEDQ